MQAIQFRRSQFNISIMNSKTWHNIFAWIVALRFDCVECMLSLLDALCHCMPNISFIFYQNFTRFDGGYCADNILFVLLSIFGCKRLNCFNQFRPIFRKPCQWIAIGTVCQSNLNFIEWIIVGALLKWLRIKKNILWIKYERKMNIQTHTPIALCINQHQLLIDDCFDWMQ